MQAVINRKLNILRKITLISIGYYLIEFFMHGVVEQIFKKDTFTSIFYLIEVHEAYDFTVLFLLIGIMWPQRRTLLYQNILDLNNVRFSLKF